MHEDVIASVNSTHGGAAGYLEWVEAGSDDDVEDDEAKEFAAILKQHEPQRKYFGKWNSQRTQGRREFFGVARARLSAQRRTLNCLVPSEEHAAQRVLVLVPGFESQAASGDGSIS